MGNKIREEITGVRVSPVADVMTVLPTPYDDRGEIDIKSLRTLVDYTIADGSAGLVCFGLASELYKLNDQERARILSTVLEQTSGRVPVIAGSESNSIESAVVRTAQYCEAGVSAVMVLPPSFVKPDDSTLVDYYREVAAAASALPVIVQDAPAWTGVPLPIHLLRHIREVAPNVTHVKVENPPNHSKIAALTEAGFICVGGYGALHLLEDMQAGVCAVMYGAGSIRSMVSLWDAARSDSILAWARFERMLPLLAFQMSSLDIFIAVQKHLLHRAGVIASPYVRRPGRQLSPHQVAWLEQLMQRQEESRA